MRASRVARPKLTRVLRTSVVALAALAMAGCGGGSSTDEATTPWTGYAPISGVTLASPEETQALIGRGGVTILDVRTPGEFAAGHIAGAENIDFYAADFADRVDSLDRGRRYVVYCHSGNRSRQATALMAKKGFTNVTDVDGGIEAWQAAQSPTVGATDPHPRGQ